MKTILILLGVALFCGSVFAGSAIVVATNIVTGNEKAVQVVNANFARKISFGTNWTKMRIGMRYRFDNVDGPSDAVGYFVVGANSSTNSLFLDSACTNFIGIGFSNLVWGVNATNAEIARSVAIRKSTNFLWSASASFASVCGSASTNLADHAIAEMLFVEITKGSPTYTLNWFTKTTATRSTNDVSTATFYAFAGLPTLTVGAGYVLSGTMTINCNEGEGAFDAICIGFNSSSKVLTIFDLAVTKVQ